jgi:hypothetical protein
VTPDDTANDVRYAHQLSCQTETRAMADVLTPVNIFHPLVLLSFGLETPFCLQMLFDLVVIYWDAPVQMKTRHSRWCYRLKMLVGSYKLSDAQSNGPSTFIELRT